MTIEGEEVVYRWAGPPAIELRRGEARLPSGLSYTAHWLRTADGASGVVVCATRGDELLLVRSLRPVAGTSLWELPRGFGEPGSDSLENARRELREETGYDATEVVDVGGFVADSSVLPTRVRVVTCVVAGDALPGSTDGETDERRWVPWGRVPELIAEGVIADGMSLAALAIAARLMG